jgi:Asp-tRNA(Asn)/Glu-tRNA(Gln) amidotransferase A subunit family amidase
LSAAQEALLIRERALSPSEALESVLAQIARQSPVLHAYSTVTADRARSFAQHAQDALRGGSGIGALRGVPV